MVKIKLKPTIRSIIIIIIATTLHNPYCTHVQLATNMSVKHKDQDQMVSTIDNGVHEWCIHTKICSNGVYSLFKVSVYIKSSYVLSASQYYKTFFFLT